MNGIASGGVTENGRIKGCTHSWTGCTIDSFVSAFLDSAFVISVSIHIRNLFLFETLRLDANHRIQMKDPNRE